MNVGVLICYKPKDYRLEYFLVFCFINLRNTALVFQVSKMEPLYILLFFHLLFSSFLQKTVKNRNFNITFHLIDNVYFFGHGELNGAIVEMPD